MPRRPPDAFVYYLDANLDGPELVERLRNADMPCEPHRAHFACDADDEAWIPVIAARGWVIVTRDFAIATDDPLQTHLGGERRGGRRNQ